MREYKNYIQNMTENELEAETKDKIWSSTFWNHMNHESHNQVDACYREWIRRKGNALIYKQLHEEVKKEYNR